MHAVETHDLTKQYGRCTALRGVNMRVPTGSLFGFLGPNGAGKTTALRILLGLLRATRGRAIVLGQDAWSSGPRLRSDVGYLPGEVRLYENLTGHDTLRFIGRARRRDIGDTVERLAALLDLDLRKRTRDYSRGMKQKLALVAAMMHRPRLLILDEPTTGLDPLVRESLCAELRRTVAEGRTVLFSSHTLAEVEALCEEVAILRDGVLVEQERVDVLRARARRHVEVRFAAGNTPAQFPDGLAVQQVANGLLTATWIGPTDRLVAWLARQRVCDVMIAPPGLEDLFLAYYGDQTGEVSA